MNIIKRFTGTLIITGLLLASCNNKPENTKKETIKLADGTVITFYSDDSGAVSFDDWNDFNTANAKIVEIEKLNYNFDDEFIENDIVELESGINNLAASIPSWLKTEEVMEDMDDVQEEYKKLLEERNEPMKNVKQNVEELIEKFDDLREEINETIETYKGK